MHVVQPFYAASQIDPIAARDAEHTRQSLEAAKSMTFSECATAYIKTHRSSWKNAKHADQWANTIKTYCGPVIGPIDAKSVGEPKENAR